MWRKSSLAFACLLAQSASSAAGTERFEFAEPHMGTLFRIVLYGDSAEAAGQAAREAFNRIAELNRELSDYDPQSELMRLCRTPLHTPTHVSKDLFRILEAAQLWARVSDGAFDATIGPLTHLWRETRLSRALPEAATIERARARVGFRFVTMDRARQTVTLGREGMLLDLGGIAKGFAADEALAALGARGIRSALIAASGDIAVSGPPPRKRGWEVAVELPDGVRRVLTLHHAAVSTSGDREQFLEARGIRYSHILDPRKGFGLQRRIGVSVIARRGVDADTLATTLSVTGKPLKRAPIAYRAIIVQQSGEHWLVTDRHFTR